MRFAQSDDKHEPARRPPAEYRPPPRDVASIERYVMRHAQVWVREQVASEALRAAPQWGYFLLGYRYEATRRKALMPSAPVEDMTDMAIVMYARQFNQMVGLKGLSPLARSLFDLGRCYVRDG